ncbi:MAG: Swt1 family HEPN domain-containing protein [Desulfobulbus sp.]
MPWRHIQTSRLRRIFFESFSAMDIAQPLTSFDTEADADTTKAFMLETGLDIVGLRVQGHMAGYVYAQELAGGKCGDYLRNFTPDDVVSNTANFVEVVKSLAINDLCFVTILDQVGAIITKIDLEKPPMRMFLFGVITLGEMMMTEIIRQRFSDGSWQNHLSPQRLEKAKVLQEERLRRGQKVDLIDCLQYGDKGWILSFQEDFRLALGLESRNAARKALNELESLRNNLAHTQEIIPTSWQRIVISCSRLERNLEIIAQNLHNPGQNGAMP